MVVLVASDDSVEHKIRQKWGCDKFDKPFLYSMANIWFRSFEAPSTFSILGQKWRNALQRFVVQLALYPNLFTVNPKMKFG